MNEALIIFDAALSRTRLHVFGLGKTVSHIIFSPFYVVLSRKLTAVS